MAGGKKKHSYAGFAGENAPRGCTVAACEMVLAGDANERPMA